MNKEIVDIFTKAATNTAEQGRLILKLKNIYQKSNPDRFRKVFLQCCLALTKYNYKKNNNQIERSLKFASAFCGNCSNSDEVDEVDQFVVDILDNLLQGHNSSQTNFCYYICKMIKLIMEKITANLGHDICGRIQEAMFKRLNDHSAAIREQAALALMRLQRPDIPNCLIIEKYIERIISDPNSTVRKVLVQKTAITRRSLPTIYQSISSVNAAVRSAAYLRCSAQEPRVFEIEQRQFLVINIAYDDHEPNRSILERRLWPRWLDVHRATVVKAASKAALKRNTNGNENLQIPPSETDIPDSCLLLLHMLRLDEDVDQLHRTYLAYKVVLNVHFKISQITDLIQALKLDSNKLIPLEYLTLESAFYWMYLLKYVLRDKSLDEYENEIVAELAGFCEYIDKYIKKVFIDTPFEEFTWLSNQHTLLQLLEMIIYSDLNDEFGRKRLSQLLSYILQNLKNIHEDVLKIIIRIYCKIEDFKKVCAHICEIMTDIMRPYKITPLHYIVIQERDFTIAKLKFTLTMAEDSHAAAMEAKDYLGVNEFHKEIVSLRDQIAAVPNDAQLLADHEAQQQLNGRREREAPNKNPEKHLRCCNMLSVVMKLCYNRGHKILPILYTAKVELVDGLLNNEYDYQNNELLNKALEIVTFYGLLDKDIAEIAMIPMSSPIISYRLIPQYNVSTLITSLTGFTYFILKYGLEILQNNESSDLKNAAQSNKELSQSSNYTRLERSTCIEDVQRNIENIDLENIPFEEFQAVILEMLDDENPTLSCHAAICITTLLKHNIGINVAVISKILLKWFTPNSYETLPKTLYILSVGISKLVDTRIENIGTIMEEATMLTLRNIIETPVDSSLYSCDLPKCLQFLASITMMAQPHQSELHRKLAQIIIPQLNSGCIDIRSKEIYSKFLSYLDAPLFDMDSVRKFAELLENTDIDGHKTTRANIAKYLSKLRNTYSGSTTDNLAASTQATISIIPEDNSIPLLETPSVRNRFADSAMICSTPVNNRSAASERCLAAHNEEVREISYHISEADKDSRSDNSVGTLDCMQAKGSNNAFKKLNKDTAVSPTDLDRNSSDAECNKEFNYNDKRPLRQYTLRNKRLHNTDIEYFFQDSDCGPSLQSGSHTQKKRRLSLNIPNSITNSNERLKQNTVCTNLAEIQSGNSSQGSTDSSSSIKRGPPFSQTRLNSYVQLSNLSRRTSEPRGSESIDENSRIPIQVCADVHYPLNGFSTPESDTGSLSSLSPCNRPRKKLRTRPRLSAVQRNRIDGQISMYNDINTKLQSIENNFDAIDIVTVSSSSKQETILCNKGKRMLKKKK